MIKRWLSGFALLVLAVGFYGLVPSQAQVPLAVGENAQLPVEPQECTFFGAERERFNPPDRKNGSAASRLTQQFSALANKNGTALGRTKPFTAAGNIVDKYILADLQANNITPALKTNDWEFIRRVTLAL